MSTWSTSMQRRTQLAHLAHVYIQECSVCHNNATYQRHVLTTILWQCLPASARSNWSYRAYCRNTRISLTVSPVSTNPLVSC